MEKIVLNEALTLAFPDGFRKLDEGELSRLRMLQSGPGICLRDDDRHIIVSLGYRQAGWLAGLLSGKDLIKNAQDRIAGVMRPYGYRQTGCQDRRVGSKTAQAFQYAYVAQDTEMVGECCAVKEGKTIYYLHFYVRKACREDGLRLWQEILADARWA